jgi:hypothetical protein
MSPLLDSLPGAAKSPFCSMRSPDALLTLLLLSSYWQLSYYRRRVGWGSKMSLADADWATMVRGFRYSERVFGRFQRLENVAGIARTLAQHTQTLAQIDHPFLISTIFISINLTMALLK